MFSVKKDRNQEVFHFKVAISLLYRLNIVVSLILHVPFPNQHKYLLGSIVMFVYDIYSERRVKSKQHKELWLKMTAGL